MAKDAPRYRVLETSYIGHQIVEPGAEIEYDGEPGRALEPLNDAAKANTKVAERNRKAVIVTPSVKAIAEAIAQLTAPQREELAAATDQGRVLDPGADRVNDSPFTPAQNASQNTTGTPPLEAQDEKKRDPRDKGDPALVQGSKAQKAAETDTERLQREAGEAQRKADEKDIA